MLTESLLLLSAFISFGCKMGKMCQSYVCHMTTRYTYYRYHTVWIPLHLTPACRISSTEATVDESLRLRTKDIERAKQRKKSFFLFNFVTTCYCTKWFRWNFTHPNSRALCQHNFKMFTTTYWLSPQANVHNVRVQSTMLKSKVTAKDRIMWYELMRAKKKMKKKYCADTMCGGEEGSQTRCSE